MSPLICEAKFISVHVTRSLILGLGLVFRLYVHVPSHSAYIFEPLSASKQNVTGMAFR